MYVDLWGWFRDFEWDAIRRGDTQRRRLVDLSREGWRYRELAEGEKAVASFEEGAMIAKQLNESCWQIFHQYWVAEMKFYLLHDYQGTLDYIVRLTAEARKEQYETCPVRSRVFFVLANIYYVLDFFGYEQEVIQLLDYMENEILMDEDTYLRVLHMRAEVELDYERYAAAKEKTQAMLNLANFNDFRLRSGYDMLRTIAFAQGDVNLALEYNRIAQRHAYRIQIQRSIAEGKLWEAVYLKRLGEDSAAREYYYSALAHYEQYHLAREVDYHDACAEYLELNGEKDEALKLRHALIEIVLKKHSILNQMAAYRAYLRLLGRMGKDFSEALAAAKTIANTSRKPTIYLERLARIEAGNYFEHDWQQGK